MLFQWYSEKVNSTAFDCLIKGGVLLSAPVVESNEGEEREKPEVNRKENEEKTQTNQERTKKIFNKSRRILKNLENIFRES